MELKNILNKSTSDLKILLISVNNLWRYSNVGIDQIAGYLRRKGYTVDILYHHTKVDFKEVISKLSDYSLGRRVPHKILQGDFFKITKKAWNCSANWIY